MIDIALLRAMAAAGASTDMIISAIELAVAPILERRAKDAERKRVERARVLGRPRTSMDVLGCHGTSQDTKVPLIEERKKVSKKERERPRKRGPSKSLLPEGWQPSPESFSLSDSGELEKMRDWARANGARKVDWGATWRNWKRRAAEFQGKGGKTNGQTTSVISDFQARWEANTKKQLEERESREAAHARKAQSN
jgi:hypothetical protein